MSSGMIGADPQALRDLASKFDNAAQDLRGTKGSIQTWVDRVDIWRGLDNNQFANDWACTASPALLATSETLIRYADILRQNAEAQDQTSIDYGKTSSSGLFCSEDDATPPAQASASESASELFRKLHNQNPDSADGVRIEKILGEDGETRFIVYINGTGQGGSDTFSIGDAFSAEFGAVTNTEMMVRRAMLEAGIGADAEVLYVGYSQGGIVAQNIASSQEFGSGVVLAQGSPRTSAAQVGYDMIHINLFGDEIVSTVGVGDFVYDHGNDLLGVVNPQIGFDYVYTHRELDIVLGAGMKQAENIAGLPRGEASGIHEFFPIHTDMDAYERATKGFELDGRSGAIKSRGKLAPFMGGTVVSDTN